MNTIPHRNDLMKPTVEAIKALGGSGSVDEIVEKVISLLGIPDKLVTQPYITKRGNEDGRTQLEYELAWVRTYLKQLGVLENSTRARVLERNGYTCQMCGVAAGDPDPFGGNRTVRLTMGHILDKSKGGDDTQQNLRAVCTNCNEGLQNTALPKPDQIHLLAQIRRATIKDQEAVLNWLLQKFGLAAKKKN